MSENLYDDKEVANAFRLKALARKKFAIYEGGRKTSEKSK